METIFCFFFFSYHLFISFHINNHLAFTSSPIYHTIISYVFTQFYISLSKFLIFFSFCFLIHNLIEQK